MEPHTTQSIAEHVGGRLIGPGDLRITGLAEVARAEPGDLTFIGSRAYAAAWPDSHADAALVSQDLAPDPIDGKALIIVQNPDLAMAAVLELFAPPTQRPEPGIHPAAVIDPDATLGNGVSIGPHAYVGPHARLGDRCVLHHRATVMPHARLGHDCELMPGSVVGSRCALGQRVILHANAVIGTDGFGYRPGDADAGQPPIVKVPHLGSVEIGDHVEIGAATCIDRGKFDDTTIGEHTKIDNLVQIAHNCHIGRCVLIAGCTGVAGSVTIGEGTRIGGGVSIKDHVTVGRGVSIAGNAGVIDNIPDGQTWGGEPAKPLKIAAREELALRQLPDLLKQFRKSRREGE